MKRWIFRLAVLVSAAMAAAAAWFLLHGEPGAAPTAERPVPVRKAPRKPPPPEFAPTLDPLPPDPPAENLEPKEIPLPPDAYPWEVPGWWHEIDRKFREKEVVVDEELRTFQDLFDLLGKEVGFPVRAGPELEAWAADNSRSFPSRDSARAILETFASRTNLEIVLTADAVLLRQRGRAKVDQVTRAGRVQSALQEARERRAGTRPADPAAEEFAASPVDLAIDGVSLREASRILGERISVPVYMDAELWAANPVVRIEAGERPLSKILESVVAPMGAAWDATPRRVVLFRPSR